MLKEKLEILIERLTDRDAAQRDYALKEFKTEISGATSSMTSVPKPLKFLSPHYKRIVEIYELQIDSEFKVSKTEREILNSNLLVCFPVLTKFCSKNSQTLSQFLEWLLRMTINQTV
jgi:hypothetical protein